MFVRHRHHEIEDLISNLNKLVYFIFLKMVFVKCFPYTIEEGGRGMEKKMERVVRASEKRGLKQ